MKEFKLEPIEEVWKDVTSWEEGVRGSVMRLNVERLWQAIKKAMEGE